VAAPELKVIPQEAPAHSHQAYRVECEVSWVGNASDYAILPADAVQIDWGTVSVTEMKAFVRDDTNIVTQTLAIVPNQKGDYTMPEIRISYLNPEATPPAENPAPGTAPSASSASPSLRADPFEIVVRPDMTYVWISGGLGASLLLTALGWWSVRRFGHRPQPCPPTAPSAVPSAVQEGLHRARQRRLDGNFYEFYQELARAAEALPDSGDLAGKLKTRAQQAGYQNTRPNDDQMDGDVRDVERALARHQESFLS
jgi:hypothetical protein